MKSVKHCVPVSRLRTGPGAAATNFTVKLEATTQIIDRLLLVPRQAQWKVTGIGDGVVTDPGNDIGDIGDGFDFEL